MLIDLHLHSPASIRNGDAIQWVNLFESLDKLKKEKIRIAAFSDHNIFDLDFYQKAKKLAKSGGINLLPAIEVNVRRLDDHLANLLIVFDDDLDQKQLEEIAYLGRQIPKQGISISQVNLLFDNFRTIRIPHVGKSDYFRVDDLVKLNYDAIEITSFNHPNYLRFKKSSNLSSVVAFSDTHIWKKYPQQKFLVTDIPLKTNSFNDLKETLKNKRAIYARERV